MKKNQISVGGYYLAKVNGRTVPVRVDGTRTSYAGQTLYNITNLKTSRTTQFRSAAKFQREITKEQADRVIEGFRSSPHATEVYLPEDFSNTSDTSEGEQSADPIQHTEQEEMDGALSVEETPGDTTSAQTTAPASLLPEICAGDRVYLSDSGPSPWTVHSTIGTLANLIDGKGRMRPAVPMEEISLTSPDFGTAERLSAEEIQELTHPGQKDTVEAYAEDMRKGTWSMPFPATSAPVRPTAPVTVSSSASAIERMKTNARASATAGEYLRSHKSGAHIIVRARAGTGKTTTAIEGLKSCMGIPVRIDPSAQQATVWNCLRESWAGGKKPTVAIVAFNKPIATELQSKVPAGVQAMTMHSMGYKAVMAAFGRLKAPGGYRTDNLLEEILGVDIRTLRKERVGFVSAVKDLVSYCKQTLTKGEDTEGLDRLVNHFLIEMDGLDRGEVYGTVARALERSKDVRRCGYVDFDDMIWLPIILNLPITKYDLLLVDEAQDLNAARQELAVRAGHRIVLIGDDRQAIYGFTGADVEGLDTMYKRLGATPRGCSILPLTVTRRCGKAIVAEAQKEVPDFEAHESNPDGKISEAKYPAKSKTTRMEPPYEETYMPLVQDGDMILCRVNAPLVSQCFRFLKRGKRAYIQGRDIGEGIIKMIEGFKVKDVVSLIEKMETWLTEETKKENAKKNPNEAKLIALQDKVDCLMFFCEGETSVDAVSAKVRTIFSDGKECPKCKKQGGADQAECWGCKCPLVPIVGIRLSSVHKAKGLEAPRVFLLQPEGASIPHPMARSAWQIGQEWNIWYVAVTRAIEELVYVY